MECVTNELIEFCCAIVNDKAALAVCGGAVCDQIEFCGEETPPTAVGDGMDDLGIVAGICAGDGANTAVEGLDGVTAHTAIIIYTPNTPKCEYYNNTPAYVAIPNLALKFDEACWHLLIMKVNYATGKYLSVQIDHILADLSAYSYRQAATANPSRLEATVAISTIGASPCDINLDEILIHER